LIVAVFLEAIDGLVTALLGGEYLRKNNDPTLS
jgi:hypothetical protein